MGGARVSECTASRWCTVTAAGSATPTASQLAIGNVRAGTKLGVTAEETRLQQLGGQILSGTLRGACAWSQYLRDWAPPHGSASSGCPKPVLNTDQFIARGGSAIYSGCYPRCWGGVPLRFDAGCGTRGQKFCYSHNCEEYANFFPWRPGAHPIDPLRFTHSHLLEVRYLARYRDSQTGDPFYMVWDIHVRHGFGNWVFIDGAACGVTPGRTGEHHTLPSYLQ